MSQAMNGRWVPGPWRWMFLKETPAILAPDRPSGEWVASVVEWAGHINVAANANLIMAAPELYAALLNITGKFEIVCRHLGSGEEYIKIATGDARAALARACGEPE